MIDGFRFRESYGSVESVKAASDVYLPVGGEVVEVNTVSHFITPTVTTRYLTWETVVIYRNLKQPPKQ